MSLEADIMDAVLALFDDKVYDATTRQRGYTQPEQIGPGELPLVQVYVPVTASDTSEDGQQTDTLAFVLSLHDIKGKADGMRSAISALSLALDRDPTLGGLAQRALVTGYSIAELGPEENTRADATIEVLYFTDGIFNNVGGDVELLPLDGRSDDIGKRDGDNQRDSTRIPSGVEVQKLDPVRNSSQMLFGDGSVDYDITTLVLPLKLTRFLRVSLYCYPECDPDPPLVDSDPALISVELGLWKSFGPTARIGYTFTGGRFGWNHLVFDLDNPDIVVGDGMDPAVDTPIRVSLNYFFPDVDARMDDFSLVLARIFYRPSDLR